MSAQHRQQVYTTTVRLSLENKRFLSSIALRILTRNGAHVGRSQLVRAFINGLAASPASGLDLGECTSEADVVRTIAAAIAAGADNGKTRTAGGR